MKISIYISQPPEKDLLSGLKIISKLKKLAGERVQFATTNTALILSGTFDGLCRDLCHLKDSDFAVFMDGWDNDKRCVVERCAANEYGIPYCDEHNLETFFKDYIKKSFNFDI